jgi:YHS domain-containing protein
VNAQRGKTGIDPVCGMRVEISDAHADGRALEFSAATYVFCSDGCLAEFLASPETYQDSTTDPAEG